MTSEGTPPRPAETFRFDPRDLIRNPFVTCPKCGQEAFGILSIFSDRYARRCKSCLHPGGSVRSAVFPLPELNKRVVYLDQVAISEMMKAIHPQTKNSRDRAKWKSLFERIDTLCKMNLVACPKSGFHHEESYVWKQFEELRRMYEHFSDDVRFRSSREIKLAQITRHVAQWLASEPPDGSEIKRRDAIEGNVDAWLEMIRISLKTDYSPDLAEGLRNHRARDHESMTSLFEDWRKHGKRRFKSWYESEVNGFGPELLRQQLAYEVARHERLVGDTALLEQIVSPPLVLEFFQCAVRECRRDIADLDDAIDKTNEYFRNADFSAVPFVRISSLLLAGLARRAASGQKRPPSRGMFTDINMVSVLLPYCDAIFVDREIEGLLAEGDVQRRLGCETAVFSARNFDSFFAYLDRIEAAASRQHLDALTEVYGNRWREPFASMYDDEE